MFFGGGVFLVVDRCFEDSKRVGPFGYVFFQSTLASALVPCLAVLITQCDATDPSPRWT